jgi:dTDP-4-amino-4,6-dideoxygalactose transaminase
MPNQKQAISDLALCGGQPAFEEKLHVGRPNVGNREHLLARINDILDRRWLTNRGPYVQEFERRIADLVGVKHCIAMCNATIALEIAARALGLTGEVIVPSFTFIATAHALQWQEITPVFCDVDPRTHNIDPGRVEALITPRTTGIIGVHLWGRPCDIASLTAIAQRRNLKLLFDSAHALGCTYHGRKIGGFGQAEVFSFHATKFLNALEGGAVVTNDDALAEKIRLMQNFGFSGYDNVIHVGTNGKMNEMSAAVGLTNLECLDTFVHINHRNYTAYQQALADVPGVRLLTYDESQPANYQYIVLEVDEAVTQLSRDDLVRLLHAENVLARRYFYPGCHQMEPYRSYQPHASLLLPETTKLAQRVLLLPTGTAVTEADIAVMGQCLRFAIQHGREISQRLRAPASPDPLTAERRL